MIATYQDYTDYFRAFALSSRDLNPDQDDKGHFYEFEERFSGASVQGYNLILIQPECSPVDNTADNEQLRWKGEAWILAAVPKQDPEKRMERMNKCEALATALRKKMRADWKDYSLGTNRPFLTLDLSKIKQYQMDYNVGELMRGYCLEFEFMNPDQKMIDQTLFW